LAQGPLSVALGRSRETSQDSDSWGRLLDCSGPCYLAFRNRVFDMAVVLSPDDRRTVAQISNLPLRSPEGNYVPLRQLANIYETSGRYIVLHQGARRVQTITCNAAGRDVPSFVADAK